MGACGVVRISLGGGLSGSTAGAGCSWVALTFAARTRVAWASALVSPGAAPRAKGVADVVLAVAERRLAVLPCLAPVNRCEHHEKTPIAARPGVVPCRARHLAALFQKVFARGVVADSALPDDVRLGGME